MWDGAGMWDNRSISISHFWCLIVGLLINRGCCLLGRRSLPPPPPHHHHPQPSISPPQTIPQFTVRVKSASSPTLTKSCGSVRTFCAWYQPLRSGACRHRVPLFLRRRPANVKNTCLREEVAQLCFLPPLRGQIVLEKSIPGAGQSLKLILPSLLVRTLCVTKNTFSRWD